LAVLPDLRAGYATGDALIDVTVTAKSDGRRGVRLHSSATTLYRYTGRRDHRPTWQKTERAETGGGARQCQGGSCAAERTAMA
jgi:hypothetical protein